MNKRSRRQHLVGSTSRGATMEPPTAGILPPSTSQTGRSSFELIDAVLAAAGELLTAQHGASLRHHLPEDAAMFARYAGRLAGLRTTLRMSALIADAPMGPVPCGEAADRAIPSIDPVFEEASWVTIPPSEVWLFGDQFGRNARGGQPYAGRPMPQRIEIPAFRIARHPVTRAQYAHFLRATGHPAPPAWEAQQTGSTNALPVTHVDATDAEAFCTWLADVSGSSVRLPTELEWQQAAFSKQIRAQCPPYSNESDGRAGGLWEWVSVVWRGINCADHVLRSLRLSSDHTDAPHSLVGFRPLIDARAH